MHASWLNQAEIYHSIIQRKVLDPNDVPDTAAVARALNGFEHRHNQITKPFEWKFRIALGSVQKLSLQVGRIVGWRGETGGR